MNDASAFLLLTIAATFFAAGTVMGVTGMGLPTVAMGVLGGLLSPLAAASLLIIPSFVTNVWQLVVGPNLGAITRRLWSMMTGILVGTMGSAFLLAGGNTESSTFMLGLALTAYAFYTLFARPYAVAKRHEPWLSPLIGLVSGLVVGATGVFVIPAVPYIQSLGFEKDDLVQALGLSFTVSTIALAAGLFSQGALALDGTMLSSLAVVPALVGMWAGQFIRRAVSPAMFRRGFLIALALLGAEMMLRSVW